MKAIETSYKGYRFRSRLEARWAVFFDVLKLKWEYEPEGYVLSDGTKYLPDFRIQIAGGNWCWFEVKGRPPTQEEIAKAQRLADESESYVFVSSGTMGVPTVNGKIVEGSRIVECVPITSVFPGPFTLGEGVELFRGFRHLCGFYEECDGSVCIDHLYAEDLDFLPGNSVPRQVKKVCETGLYESINIGAGRRYRSERLRDAYAAARSARFEYGERPRM